MAFYKCGGGGADTSIVTATAEDVLSPKVIVDVNGNPLTGTMKNNGAVSQTLNAGGSYTIPAGYHNGSGKITANSLENQGAGKVISGKTSVSASLTSSQLEGSYYGTSRELFSVSVGFTPKYVMLNGYLKFNDGVIRITNFFLKDNQNYILLSNSNEAYPPIGSTSTNDPHYQFYIRAYYSSSSLIVTMGSSTNVYNSSMSASGTWKYAIFG